MKKILFTCLFIAPMAFTHGIFASLEDPMKVGMEVGTSGIKTEKSIGLEKIKTSVNFVHKVGYDFEYGVTLEGAFKSIKSSLFSPQGKNNMGFYMNVELMSRYLPEVSDNIFVGGFLSLSWQRSFSEVAKNIYKSVSFGDMSFSIGPSFMMNFTQEIYGYSDLLFSMTDLRFGIKDPSIKKDSFLMGTILNLGAGFLVAPNVTTYVQMSPKITNFQQITHSLGLDFNIGVSMAI